MHKLYKLFPKVDVCVSNHTSRPYRLASSVGVPARFLKGYNDWMEAPKGWRWNDRYIVDGVLYIHGEGYSGKYGALNAAQANRMSTVIGHLHSFASVIYSAGPNDLIFGMNSGCLIDSKTYAFRYGKHLKNKPTIGAAVVMDGLQATFYPMNLGSKVFRR